MNVEIPVPVPLKYLSNFWRTLEIPLIHCEITFDLIWSAKSVILERNRVKTFVMTNAKLYVPVVTLSTKYNGMLLQQLKLCFRGTGNWNKYLSRVKTLVEN